MQIRDGFSLIEVLVAIVLVAIGTASTAGLMLSAAATVRHASDTRLVAAVAEYHLTRVAVEAVETGIVRPDTVSCSSIGFECVIVLDVGSMEAYPELRRVTASARTERGRWEAETVVHLSGHVHE